MDKKYNVDDILSEVKSKRQRQASRRAPGQTERPASVSKGAQEPAPFRWEPDGPSAGEKPQGAPVERMAPPAPKAPAQQVPAKEREEQAARRAAMEDFTGRFSKEFVPQKPPAAHVAVEDVPSSAPAKEPAAPRPPVSLHTGEAAKDAAQSAFAREDAPDQGAASGAGFSFQAESPAGVTGEEKAATAVRPNERGAAGEKASPAAKAAPAKTAPADDVMRKTASNGSDGEKNPSEEAFTAPVNAAGTTGSTAPTGPAENTPGGFSFDLDNTASSGFEPLLTEEDEAAQIGFTRVVDGKKVHTIDDKVIKQHNEVQKSREKKIQDFVLFSDEEPENDLSEEYEGPAVPEEIDDYHSKEDKPSVIHDLSNLHTSLFIRICIVALMGLFSAYLTAAEVLNLPIPAAISPATAPQIYGICQLALVFISCIVCHQTVGGGILSLFKLRADSDSLTALASLSVIIGCVATVISPESFASSDVHIYPVVAILGLLFNTIGKLLIVRRVAQNFHLVSADGDKYTLSRVEDENIAFELTKGMGIVKPNAAVSAKTHFLSNFLEYSYCEDITDNVSRVLAPISLIGALVVSISCFFMEKNAFECITIFSSILCICAPFSAMFIANLPLYKASKRLSEEGGMISGYRAIEELSDLNAVVISAGELFPKGSVMLHGIKTFGQRRIDEAILDAASVVCTCETTLADVFLQVIEGKQDILKPVDSLVYEDAMGLSAWVDSKRVLIGNRELMLNHGVDIPSKDYEDRYAKDGREILYLSNSGELTAMFILSYNSLEHIRDAVEELVDNDIVLLVSTNDPNVTAEKIASVFGIGIEFVSILSTRLREDLRDVQKVKPKAPASIAFAGKFSVLTDTLSSLFAIKSSIGMGLIVQTVSVILGYGLAVFFAYFGGMAQLTVLSVLVYQVFWLAAILILNMIKKV
ncbi:hypothetical protein [Zongyangia hominis]|uniref:Uncharacterized protein n=1 Tax=Zongyangia hominis TaxID=2763677 RepID=A0A926I7E7_9FIRM|nr:hypothetical protein [Zongyangia hominis]MBC8571019.1 hypothetical protein [Zongyangia hominis]